MTSRLFELEDSNVRAMLRDPQILELLPCLAQPKKKIESIKKGKENCNRCEKEKKKIQQSAIRAAKLCIKNTRGAALQQLKKKLGVKNIRLRARNSSGKPVQYTI